MSFPAEVLPGQRLTADRLNAGFAVGRLVFFAARDATQSVSSMLSPAASNAMSWDNVVLDLLGGWSASTPTRYTPPIAGWYQLSGSTSFSDADAGDARGSSWFVNGSVATASTSRPIAAVPAREGTAEARNGLPVQLDGNDYVELIAIQNSGTSQTTLTGSLRPYMAVYYVGPS